MVLALLPAIGDFNNGWYLMYFRKLWIRLLEVYDGLRGIGWMEMAIP